MHSKRDNYFVGIMKPLKINGFLRKSKNAVSIKNDVLLWKRTTKMIESLRGVHFAPLGGCIFAEGGAFLILCKLSSHTSRRMLTGADPLK